MHGARINLDLRAGLLHTREQFTHKTQAAFVIGIRRHMGGGNGIATRLNGKDFSLPKLKRITGHCHDIAARKKCALVLHAQCFRPVEMLDRAADK